MKLRLQKKDKDTKSLEELSATLSDCSERLSYYRESLLTLLAYLRDFSLDIKEIESEAFKTDIDDLTVVFESDKKLRKLKSVFDRHQKRLRRYIKRQYEYIHDREKELKDIIDLSVVLLDIDNFKKINDGYGHQIGDRVLVALARKCSGFIRNDDIIARYGGEEFVILLPNASLENTVIKADKICKTIAQKRYALDDIEPGNTLFHNH